MDTSLGTPCITSNSQPLSIPGSMYPIVPGHELVGVVTEVGSNVNKVGVGSLVAVGCTIDCCMDCHMCEAGKENYCRKGELKIEKNSN